MLATSLMSAPSVAASEADCSIWLCLPVGFLSGCGDAKKAFKNRIKKFKPPLPSFSSCMSTRTMAGDSTWWAHEGKSALMMGGDIVSGTGCWKPSDHYGAPHPSEHEPPYCSLTLNTIQIMDGTKPFGDTVYYHKRGSNIRIYKPGEGWQ